VANWKILINQWRNELSFRDQPSHYLVFTKNDEEPGCPGGVCISALLALGVDLATVAAMAGHANLTTTARYERRGDEAKRRAGERLRVPFITPVETKGILLEGSERPAERS
jgi:hypothetical protein